MGWSPLGLWVATLAFSLRLGGSTAVRSPYGWLMAQRLEVAAEGTPDTALDVIGVSAGSVAAQVGAGAENYIIRLAERVGADGRVYAVDTQRAALDRLKKNLSAHGLSNVRLVQGTDEDPKLPAGKIDLALLVSAYHELLQPQKMLRKLHDALKPDGRLVLIEYRQDDPSAPVRAGQKVTVQDLKAEVEPEGFHFDKVLGVLPRQHILVFSRK